MQPTELALTQIFARRNTKCARPATSTLLFVFAQLLGVMPD